LHHAAQTALNVHPCIPDKLVGQHEAGSRLLASLPQPVQHQLPFEHGCQPASPQAAVGDGTAVVIYLTKAYFVCTDHMQLGGLGRTVAPPRSVPAPIKCAAVTKLTSQSLATLMRMGRTWTSLNQGAHGPGVQVGVDTGRGDEGRGGAGTYPTFGVCVGGCDGEGSAPQCPPFHPRPPPAPPPPPHTHNGQRHQ
jgi:hypothetical protein